MLFSKPPKPFDPLLYQGELKQPPPADGQPLRDRDLSGNFFLIFSVQDVVEFKQDSHKLVRRLSSLCMLLTSFLAAAVAVWLLDVVFDK